MSLPCLHTIHLINTDGHDALALKDTTTFAVAQQIRRVSLWGMSREFNMKSFNWSLLKYLTLTTHGMAFTPCMSLLVECQNLLSVSVTIIYLTEQDKEPWRSSHPPRPRYERLHTLEIFADHTDVEFGFFVHWLLLPALRRLVLKGPVGVSLRPHVMEMITRDHCKLEELVVHDNDYSLFVNEEADLLELLRATPELRRYSVGLTRRLAKISSGA